MYDSSHYYPVIAVSVLSTSGKGAVTDVNGHYELEVGEKDSVWFSYLNKPTKKFAVAKINDLSQFDVSLQVNIPVLTEVRIKPRNYRLDSLQNRLDYAKIFNYQRVNIQSLTSIGPEGAGFDLDEIIRGFQFRKNRSMLAFQRRLIEQEQDKYVDHKFNKALVRRLTQLDSTDLDSFMVQYRPSYEFVQLADEYSFMKYIKDSGIQYKLQHGLMKEALKPKEGF